MWVQEQTGGVAAFIEKLYLAWKVTNSEAIKGWESTFCRALYILSLYSLTPPHTAGETFGPIQRSCSCVPVHCSEGAETRRAQAPQLVTLAPDAANGSLFCQCLKLALLDDLCSDHGQLNTSLQNLHILSYTVAEK